MINGENNYYCYCVLFLGLLTTYNAYPLQKNYTLYRLVALTKRDRQILYFIHKNYAHSNFLNGITNEAAIPMHVAVEEEHLDVFEALLNNTDSLYSKYRNFYYSVPGPLDHEVYGTLIDDGMVFYQFNGFSTILRVYQYWESKYKSKFKKIVIGKTHEQKDIVILKVSGASIPGQKNPAVFIMGGEEGRDWISSAVVLNYVKSLLEDRFGDWTTRIDAYFLPIMNPDGYEYSMYQDRFWAKNRNTIRPRTMCSNHTVAKGVNIDRNWLYTSLPRGEKACNKMYFGEYLSEVETYNVSEFLDGIAPRTLAFFNVKGFDNLITMPFADRNKTQHNIDTIKEIIAHTCYDLSEKFNKTYYYGITKKLLFNYTGNCADWVKHHLNVPVVATFYVKHGQNVIPVSSDIQLLSSEFSSGINEILSITIDFYGPLFNSQKRHNIYIITLLLTNVCNVLFSYQYVSNSV